MGRHRKNPIIPKPDKRTEFAITLQCLERLRDKMLEQVRDFDIIIEAFKKDLLSSEPGDAVSDTSKADSSNAAGKPNL